MSRRIIISLCGLVVCIFAGLTNLSAQEEKEQADSLVRLLNAEYLEQYEEGDEQVRKAMKATFLHNGTYLSSDSSLWYRNTNIINFLGNVKLIQGDAELTSEKLDYYVDEDRAEFRGSLVQMRNEKDNILRTRILDYNTKDSIAVFSGGASMKSEDGQIIESDNGSYDNAKEYFTFDGNVNMFTDSTFIKTTALEYDSAADKAWFIEAISFWREENMLSASKGWYDRAAQTFFFRDKVHAISEEQESWSDTLYYYESIGDVLMRGVVQIQDTTRSTASLSDYVYYQDSLSRITLRDRAAVVMWEKRDSNITDTTYMGADTIVINSVRKCDIPEEEISLAATRKENILVDAIAQYRKRASDEAATARRQNQEQSGTRPSRKPSPGRPSGDNQGAAPSLMQEDTTAVEDTLAIADTLAVLPPPDTTDVGFISAIGNVKIFRQDMQVKCDSMRFTELDSIARFYKEPLVWNEGTRQYSSDSLFVLVNKDGIDRASLLSNAFISVFEDSVHFDQIKSTEVLAYFDSTTALRRFDALGGVTALFFLREDDVIATVNKVEARTLSANLKEGDIDRVYYFDSPRNDAYPVVQLPEEERILKGFNWDPDSRPKSKADITTISLKPSERSRYMRIPRPVFAQTDRFFPGLMQDIRQGLADAKLRKSQTAPQEDSLTLDKSARPDSLQLADSLKISVADSLAVVDTVAVEAGAKAEVQQEEEEYMSKAELRRAMRIARRDARWAELDARDAAKAAEKAAKKAAKEKRKAERLAKIRARQEARDKKLLDKYIEYYTQKKEEDERKQKSKSLITRERTQAPEAGGEVFSIAEIE